MTYACGHSLIYTGLRRFSTGGLMLEECGFQRLNSLPLCIQPNVRLEIEHLPADMTRNAHDELVA